MPITVIPSISATSVSTYQGTGAQGTVQNVWLLDGLVYSCNSISGASSGYSGQEAAIEADFYYPSGTDFSQLTVQTSSAAKAGATGMIYAYNWTTRVFDFLGQGALNPTQTTLNASVTSPASRYLSSSGEVRTLDKSRRAVACLRCAVLLAADLIQLVVQ